MKRLTLDKELLLMPQETEERNIEGFERLLPYFYLTKRHEKRVIRSLRQKSRPDTEHYLDEFLNLNGQRRAWFVTDPIVENDEAFKEFNAEITRMATLESNLIWSGRFRACPTLEFISRFSIHNYENFLNNEVHISGQRKKLFKVMMAEGILSQSIVEKISSLRVKESAYLCISRNPIDYLFCSTNQNFSSCEDLYSNHEGAFYMGLGGLTLDPNRLIVFITSSKNNTAYHSTKDINFCHFKYTCRAWGILGREEELFITTHYPNESVNFALKLRENGYDAKSTRELTELFLGKFKWKLPKFQTEIYSHIYLDGLGIVTDEDTGEAHYSAKRGRTACIFGFRWSDGFDTIRDLDDILNGISCSSCGGDTEGESNTNPDGDYLCRYCFDRDCIYCQDCGNLLWLEDAMMGTANQAMCNNCWEKFFFRCSECDEVYSLDVQNEEGLCNECWNSSYFICSVCGDTYEDCYRNEDDTCDDCTDELIKEEDEEE